MLPYLPNYIIKIVGVKNIDNLRIGSSVFSLSLSVSLSPPSLSPPMFYFTKQLDCSFHLRISVACRIDSKEVLSYVNTFSN